MQDILLTQSKKKGMRRGSIFYTPGGSPIEPTLPRHVRPADSPSSVTPRPRATSTPETEPRYKPHQRRECFSTPTNPSPLQNEILRQQRHGVEIQARYCNLNFNVEDVEKFIRKVEGIA
ncbi:hypothetical protein O181_039358 [Austropuccinia psidii MF-1]|uniref:Uncharacterized protein n=1 Tax=Austropuccinia psidii MF-1 TaxID=1389203 RepID=A0A9Q3HBX1_9BASI|nr:hypothetical protein [Austropuccinia psidii MF-1]